MIYDRSSTNSVFPCQIIPFKPFFLKELCNVSHFMPKNSQAMNLTSHAWWELGKDSENAILIQKVTELILQAPIWNWLSREPWKFGKLMGMCSKYTRAYTSKKPYHKTENIVSTWLYNCLFKRELCRFLGSYLRDHLT